jgi:LacI family transcriptional regulator
MESKDSKPRATSASATPKGKSARAARRSDSSAVTIRDVAERSGFSSATVSIVLNSAPLARYIPDATKTRIQRAATQLGYRPNLFARSLRSRRSHTVGVMVFDMTDPYCTLVLRGIENTLYQASFLPILTDVHNDRTRFERYLEMLLDRRIEGLVVLANWLFVDINFLADLEKNANIPTAVVGRELKTDAVSSVIVDNSLGAQAALDHLYSLGHRKIAFIRGPHQLSDTEPRWRGVRSLAKERDLQLDPRLILDLPESRDPFSSFEDGYKLTEELLRRRPFTAIMAFDDMTAFGAIRALTKAGVRVPEQCSVVGFDDVSPSAIYSPALTTVRQPMEMMGSTAATIVVEAINAGLEKKQIHNIHRRIVPELIVRESTRSVK